MSSLAEVVPGPVVVNLTGSIGSMLIGEYLACVVWGINCVQLFWYFNVYVTDPLYLKATVIFLWIMDTADHILVLQGTWTPLISRWGSAPELQKLLPGETHHVWTSAIVGLGVQLFFIHRVYILSGNRLLLPTILVMLCIYQLVATIIYLVLGFRHGTLEYLGSPIILAFQLSDRACTVAVDIGISASIVFFLLRMGIPQFTSSRQMFFRVIVVTVNTNMWTAIAALIDFCLVASKPHGFYFCIIEMPLSSMYFGSFLGNLNSRRFVREGVSSALNELMSALPEDLVGPTATSNTIVFRRFESTGRSMPTMDTDQETGIQMLTSQSVISKD